MVVVVYFKKIKIAIKVSLKQTGEEAFPTVLGLCRRVAFFFGRGVVVVVVVVVEVTSSSSSPSSS